MHVRLSEGFREPDRVRGWLREANGQVERANRSIVVGIKARLGRTRKAWLKELSHVLWAHRTMTKTSTGETPFSFTHGTEAMIPAEIESPTPRT
ncbi:hypothetical protein E3N88_08946 [Mikania micrantha]|uniref:Uncharacterized protein n=1 Tax=Mikania micrantha TaxID=192012 RepID=A0A5N6PHP1_9ASTR|nr:hypothetical protein E3N88_08946 [Mikania micrantha]